MRWLLALFGLLWACSANAQVIGCGNAGGNVGNYQLVQSSGCSSGGGASFAGSGDTLSGAYVYWSCARAYSAAYASSPGNACDIIRASDSATCTIKFAATGFADVSTAYCTGTGMQSVTAFCNATTCKVTKAYDQSGATHCTTACDVTQATDASRPVLSLSGGPNSNTVCMTFSGSQLIQSPNITAILSQPVSASAVSERTGTFTTFGDVIGTFSNNIQPILYNNAANQGGIYAGTIGSGQAVAMSDSAYHALNVVANGASSIVVVDGSATTGLNPGSAGMPSNDSFQLGNGNNPLTGSICEARVDSIAYNSMQYGNLNSNQHGTNGYNF